MDKIYEFLKRVSAVIGVFIVFISVIFAVHKYVEEIVDKKISSPEIIEKLSSKIRPFLIFDADKVILYNKGVYDEFIDKIHFEDMDSGYPKKIIIDTKKYIQVPPVLECLTYNCYAEPKRRSNNRWEYKLISKSYLELQGSEHIKDHIFRLELIK